MFYIAFKNLILIILIILILHFFIKNSLLDKETDQNQEPYCDGGNTVNTNEDNSRQQQVFVDGPLHDNVNITNVNEQSKKDEDDLLNYINNTSSSDLGTFTPGTFAMFNSPY
jgi:hypothetical protein